MAKSKSIPVKKAAPKKAAKKARLTSAEIEGKKKLAWILYVENRLEQKVIAAITGISEKSITGWKKDGEWDADREEARMGFEPQRRRIRKQIDNLLTQIESRVSPKNVPTAPEGDTINKLADAAKKLQTELSMAHKVEAGKQFITYVQATHGQAKAIEAVELWHEFQMATA